jgi:hypothetical protein
MAERVSVMNWLVATLVYLVCHFLAYAVAFRRVRAFCQERTIFLYHFLSAVALTLIVVLALIAWRPPDAPALITSSILAHALYSLSFLELWSLAEGGYSLGILRHLAAGVACNFPGDQVLASIGTLKKQSRLENLQRLGLIRNEDGLLRLTTGGRLIASVADVIARTVNMKQAA